MIDIAKVREALSTIAYAVLDDNGKIIIDYHDEECGIIANALTELERLQKKEVAMKPIKGIDGRDDCYDCPVCNSIVHETYVSHNNKYCNNCGQKLDWNDEK